MVALFFVAFSVQSFVVFTLAVSTTVRGEIERHKKELLHIGKSIEHIQIEKDGEELPGIINKRRNVISSACTSIATYEGDIFTVDNCELTEAQQRSIENTLETSKAHLHYEDIVFKLMSYRDNYAIITVPIQNDLGAIGALSTKISLLEIYNRFVPDISLITGYTIINIVLFSIIGFFRVDRSLVRPILKLVGIAEKYSEDQQPQLQHEDSRGPFRVIGKSITTMLDRIHRDNIRLKKTVEELQQSNEELSRNRQQMVRSEKLASVGRLSAGMAHEIGNPLSIVQGYVDLMGRDDISKESRIDYSEKADQELKRINSLIQEMLNFARPSNRVHEGNDLNTIVEEVTALLKIENRVKNCQITKKLIEGDASISVEKDSLKQVLINCILNAADAYEQTKNEQLIEIEVEIRVGSAGKERMIIRVQDRGKGIEEEVLPLIFDPFYSTKEVGKGTGLGLFVSHMLMERMGGEIRVRNRKPIGTVVEIELPRNPE